MLHKNKIHKYYIGLDIGGTKCSVVLGDELFQLYEKITFETSVARGYESILKDFKKSIYSLFNNYNQKNLIAIGISCGGPLDSQKGIILSPPNLPGWDEVSIVDIFNKEFGVEVSLQNDANACALAEWLMGAGKGTRNMIFLTFGTGLGAGLILNSTLYEGTNDLAGEVGHIRLEDDGPVGFGKAGSFEGFCSGGGITQLAKSTVTKKLLNNQPVSFCSKLEMVKNLDAKIVATAAQSGDPVANEIIKVSAEHLGIGLAIIIDILNPECIVIGSIYERNENLFKPEVEKVLNKEVIPGAMKVCRILPAKLGESIGDYAALCVAIYKNSLYKNRRDG